MIQVNDIPTHIDLFSGIGGFALAARWAGVKTVAFCEIEPYAQRVLRKNFPGVPIIEDIRDFPSDEFQRPWLITGGYPCQPFSQAGKRRGTEDHRHLWPAMFEVIRACRPNWVLAENVAGHVSMGLDEVLFDLESEDYSVQPIIVPACAVDAPHRRDRVWILADSEGNRRERFWPSREQKPQAHDQEELSLCESKRPRRTKSASERRLGGVVDGIPDWLDEPGDIPRVTSCQKNRIGRLKGLGNAIVPQVALNILKSLMIVSND